MSTPDRTRVFCTPGRLHALGLTPLSWAWSISLGTTLSLTGLLDGSRWFGLAEPVLALVAVTWLIYLGAGLSQSRPVSERVCLGAGLSRSRSVPEPRCDAVSDAR